MFVSADGCGLFGGCYDRSVSSYLLSGLKVIDCATVIAAPATATMLADFGADVIKVEQPEGGDMLRTLSGIDTTPDADPDWFWELHGRNKRGLVLDMKSTEGREVMHRLIGDADVFITNHPSYLLRIPDAEGKARELAKFEADLVMVRDAIAALEKTP